MMCGQYDHDYRHGGGCDKCGEPREGRLPSEPHRNVFHDDGTVTTKRPKWVGAYRVGLAYGGREEGGWWHEVWEPLASAMIRPDDDPMTVARKLWRAFESDDDGREVSDSLARGAVFVRWEDRPGDLADTTIPKYQ